MTLVRLVLLAGLVLTLSACGSEPDVTVRTRTDPTAQATPPDQDQALPTLPPVATEIPEAFDAAGCLRVAGEAECTTRSAGLDAIRAGSGEDDWRALAGFVGERWLESGGSGQVTVLTDTVTTGMGSSWSAMGLVRNETTSTVAEVSVQAELLDNSGVTRATVEVVVPVRSLRPGEPAPFALASDVPLAEVARVRWSASVPTDPSAGAPGGGRDLDLATYWQRSPEDPRPVDTWLYADDPAAPLPMVVFGSATNVGAEPLAGVEVVGAWLDGTGRVLAVARARVGVPGSTPDPSGPGVVVGPGQAADVVLVPGGTVDWAAARLMLWGTSG